MLCYIFVICNFHPLLSLSYLAFWVISYSDVKLSSLSFYYSSIFSHIGLFNCCYCCDAGRLEWRHQLDEGGRHCAGRIPGWDAGRRMQMADSRPHSEREGGFPGDRTSRYPLEGDREPSQAPAHGRNILPWHSLQVSGETGDGDHRPLGQSPPTSYSHEGGGPL